MVVSPFAVVQGRTTAGKCHKRGESATALVWKVLQVAEQTFQRLNAPELLSAVYVSIRFVNGVKQSTSVASQAVAV